ncbi:FAD-binding and (Fe-S)-binding domain-containing protein [bacterium RCC_150]
MSSTDVGAAEISHVLRELRERGIEIDDSARRRSEYSYDASNYRVRPEAVAFPKTVGDIRDILRSCAAAGIPVTTRGGGTSMAGNAVGGGVIVDVSRWMNAVGELDGESRTVWVDAGVVLGELRFYVEAATAGELTFAPDPSSLTRATIGGSIGNDACGNHSVAYGRMTHHVQEVELVTADGAYLRAGRDGLRAVDDGDPHSVARAEELNVDLGALVQANLAAIRLELEAIPRQVSGYHLGYLLPEHGFDVAAALAGSEGTCAIIVRAKVGLVPKPRTTALLCLGYEDTIESARDVVTILEAQPSAIEGLDSSIVDIMRHRRGPGSVKSLPQGNAYLMVEFSADSLEQVRADCEDLLETLRSNGRMFDDAIVTDPAERAKVWRVREDGAGLSSRRIDGIQTWPGWEDSAVAPERLADYLAELLPLVHKYGYTAFLYGHFGAGCVHMRLDYELRSESGRQAFEDFTREAAALVVAHGGSLSGEHGDGRARSELLDVMYSAEMIALFEAFKHAWDPAGILNPGIIVDPEPFAASLALDGAPIPGPAHGGEEREIEAGSIGLPVPMGLRLPLVNTFVGNAHGCIGVGRCRATTGSFMCPSYRASKDEKDSTRGRARTLQELARSKGNSGQGWSSREVRESLDLCLSCKACSTDCPTGVDIAEAKSQLIDEHYRGRFRPFTHYSIGWLPRWLPLLTRVAPVANKVTQLGPLRYLGELLGVSARRRLPAFSRERDIRRRMREAGFVEEADILLFADSFTRAFRPEAIPAAARVLRDGGRAVGCTPDACCGLTWISTGQRAGARRRLERLIRKFDDGTDRDIVVLEPSCAATIRDEGPKLVGGDASIRVAARVRSFSVAIDEAFKRGWTPKAVPPENAVLQTHCHEHAVFGSGSQRRVLQAWGVPNIVESSSCCGVAGNFGFEADHFDMSMKVAEHSIAPALEKGAEASLVLTDGFSCAMQVSQVDPSRASKHLAIALDPGAANTGPEVGQ